MKILSVDEIREVDRLSTERFGIPSLLLMENAGMRVTEILERRFSNLPELQVTVLCGKGNNGGDGFVIARQLLQKGCLPSVFLFAPEAEVRGDARVNLQILKAIGLPPTVILDEADWELEKLELLDADVVVDALLGTGASKPVDGLLASVIETVNEDLTRAVIVAVDIPSGLAADESQPMGPCIHADLTVTFTALKFALVLAPSHEAAGEVIVVDIGNPQELLSAEEYQTEAIDPARLRDRCQPRADDSNKGTYGKVAIIGGSRGKSGAPALAGQAALRAGAGLVTVAAPKCVQMAIAGSMPELMTEGLAETDAGTLRYDAPQISNLLDGKDVIGVGPGLSMEEETSSAIREILRTTATLSVVDADGLNAFRGRTSELRRRSADSPALVLTPHPGEMARLVEHPVDVIAANRIAVAREFATEHGVFVVLKGFRTAVAAPDGFVWVSMTGNPGMATAGTGDVLTGLLCGILAQENLGSVADRICLAVFLHGLAGDLAAADLGQESLVATDLLRYLPQAWKQFWGQS